MELFLEFLAVIGIILSGVLYIVPTLIGYRRGDKNLLSLAIVNVLLGFTFIGWVLAFAYATLGMSIPYINQQTENK